MRIFSPAKLNLFLAIGPRDESGFHTLDTVFFRYEGLQDRIEIEPAQELKIEFVENYRYEITAGGEIEPRNNSVIKAVRLSEQKSGRALKYSITVHKNIPPGSGLGGAAGNAAATLLYLNQAENLGFSTRELMDLGAQIGMDVPFFVSGFQVARGTHFGEKIEKLPDLPEGIEFNVTLPLQPTLTKEAYKKWDDRTLRSTAKIHVFLEALNSQNPADILAALHNDFNQLNGAQSFLCGSGGATFVASVRDMKNTQNQE